MKSWKRAAAAALVILQLVLTGAAVAVSFREDPAAVAAASKSVLALQAFDAQDKFIASGCGFVAFDNMSIVTSYGILKGADWLIAMDGAGSRYLVTHIIAADEKKDVAILAFFSPTDLTPLALSAPDGDLPLNESKVAAIGRRPWEESAVSLGSVSAAYEKEGVSRIEYTSQEAVIPGGVLMNEEGIVIGIAAGQAGEGVQLAVSFKHAGELWIESLSAQSKTFAEFFGGRHSDAFPFPLPDPDKAMAAVPTPVPKGLLTAPGNVTAQWTASGMQITWDPGSNAKQYDVYRSPQRDAGFVRIGAADRTEYVDADAGDRLWFYKVESQKADGATATSAAAAGFPPLNVTKGLTAPKSVKTKTSANQVTVTFGAVKSAKWYVVYRSVKKDKGYEAVGQVEATTFVDRDVKLSQTYYYKVSSVSGSDMSGQSAAAAAKMPKPTPTVKPTPTPYVEPEFFLQVGKEARWNKKNGYWQANPRIVNGSKTSTVDAFTLTYYCEDIYGNMIRRNGDGDYYTDAVYEKTIKPGKSLMPGYTWLEGYEEPAYICIAVTRIHTTDGRTIDIPRERWYVGYIGLN